MKLSNTCIKRPVFAIVLSLIIIMVGLSSYHYLELRFFPNFEAKSIEIQTTFSGASAQLIESAVTNPLESALSTIPGIKRMVSTSSRGQSDIKLELKPGQNVDEIANDVRNKVSAAQGDLPDSVKAPTIQVGWGSDSFLSLAVTDPNKPPKAIRDYLQRYVLNNLLQVPGMANIEIDGADKYAMRIELNPQAMASLSISTTDVEQALLNNNIEMPAGIINLTPPKGGGLVQRLKPHYG